MWPDVHAILNQTRNQTSSKLLWAEIIFWTAWNIFMHGIHKVIQYIFFNMLHIRHNFQGCKCSPDNKSFKSTSPQRMSLSDLNSNQRSRGCTFQLLNSLLINSLMAGVSLAYYNIKLLSVAKIDCIYLKNRCFTFLWIIINFDFLICF